MAFPRHASRHVQATVLKLIETQMTTLGWTQDNTLPFGTAYATAVHFTDTPAIAGDRLLADVGPGLVACTMGPESYTEEQEIGGPLSLQEYPIFFDVFQSTYAAATGLANDVRDTLMGRLPGTKRHVPIIDQVTGNPIAGWTCELTDIELVRPEIRLPLHWQVVKVTASVYFPEVQY